jgi:peptidoglycan hydrolase CwlO-like protein
MKLVIILKIFKDKFFLLYTFLFTIIFSIIIFLSFDSLSKEYNDFEYDKYVNIEIPLNSSQKEIIEYEKNIVNVYTDIDKLENQKEKYDKIIQDLKDKIKQKDLELSKSNIDVKIEYRPYYFENEILTNT